MYVDDLSSSRSFSMICQHRLFVVLIICPTGSHAFSFLFYTYQIHLVSHAIQGLEASSRWADRLAWPIQVLLKSFCVSIALHHSLRANFCASDSPAAVVTYRPLRPGYTAAHGGVKCSSPCIHTRYGKENVLIHDHPSFTSVVCAFRD